jgi:hypothetical protein
MDSRINNVTRPDVVMIESTPRPTPRPARVAFREVLAAGAASLVHGAEVALSKLPGSPITAAAVRGSPSPGTMTVTSALGAAPGNSAPEGPGATGGVGGGASVGVGTAGPLSAMGTAGNAGAASGVAASGLNVGVPGATDASGGGIEAAMQQQAELSLYYLQIQQQEDAQNRTFTAMSNILKTSHDSAKAAINNIHS